MVLDRLSVALSASAVDFNAGMNAAERASDSVRLALRRLGFAADEAEDELSQTGRSAATASGGMATFGATTQGAGFAVRGLSSSIVLSLIPALVSLFAAATTAAAALGGLVTIAGSIAGIGLIGVIGAIATETEFLKTQFQALISDVKEEFAPVFETAAAVLDMLIQEFRGIIPELVPAEEAIMGIGAAFGNLGSAIIDSLPAFAELAVTLAQEFLPPFVEFVEDVLPEVPGMLQAMVAEFEFLLPFLMDSGRALGDLLPPLIEFGRTVISTLAPALGAFSDGLAATLSAVNNLDEGLQGLVAGGSVLAPVLVGIISLIGGISTPLLVAIGAITAFAAAFATNFGGVRDTVMSFVSEAEAMLGNRLPGIIEDFAQVWRDIRPIIEPIIGFLAGSIKNVLITALDGVLTALEAIGQLLTGDFTGAFETVQGFFKRWVTRLLTFWNDVTNGFLENFVNRIIRGLNVVGDKLQRFADFAGIDFKFESFDQLDISNIGQQAMTPQSQFERGSARAVGAGSPAQVNVRVEGDTDVVRDVSAEVVDQQNRRNGNEVRNRTGVRPTR